MTYNNAAVLSILKISLLMLLVSCSDEDPPRASNEISFSTESIGFDDTESEVLVTLTFNRQLDTQAILLIDIVTSGLTYGEDFSTDPQVEDNTLSLQVPQGAQQASFTVFKNDAAAFDGDESITFTINDVPGELTVGSRSAMTIQFTEIIAVSSSMDPNVGGQLQPNKVFIDLSANRQTVHHRSDWDLGFYTLAGEHRVILNSSSSMMVRALEKTDLTDVNANDTLGWSRELSTDAVFAAITSPSVPAWAFNAHAWIDDPSGDLNNTAIAPPSEVAEENRVYIVNRGKHPDGTPRGWKKIRVLRNGDHYTLEHGDIDATTFSTVDITKDDNYLFNYVKFEDGQVQIEPKKEKWDLAFTVFTNTTPAGPGLTVPYVFSDIVIQNRYHTQTAELIIADGLSYETFDEEDLSGITFSNNQVNIGPKWRSGGGPGSGPALKEDRFYIIEDSAGNIYKLRFTALTQNGERGRPQIEYALIRKG